MVEANQSYHPPNRSGHHRGGEVYRAEMMKRVSSFKQSIDLLKSQ